MSAILLPGGPEQLFGITELKPTADGGLRATMPSGPWLADGRGAARAASLGVLVDIVLGYAVNALTDSWSVSTELSLDLLADVPLDGSPIECAGQVSDRDADGALVTGTVTAAGAVLARAVLRGRYVPLAPPADLLESPSPSATFDLDRRDLFTTLGREVDLTGDDLAVVDVTSRLTNPLGNLHGGIVLALHELAGARLLPSPDRTASVRIQLARGVPAGTRLTFEGAALHTGRTLAVGQLVARDERGRVCSTSTVVRHWSPGRAQGR